MTDTQTRPAPFSVGLTVGLLTLEALGPAWGLLHGWPLAAAAAVHFGVTGTAAVLVLRSRWRSDRHALLLVLVTAVFGPLGPAGMLLAMALEWYHARQATSIEQWHETLFPPSGVDEQVKLWRRIGQRANDAPGNARVTPFLDVLAFGSVQQRQAAVAIIAQQFRPAFASALKAALRDEHNVIRVQAATVIARLEQEFFDRTFDLEAAVREAPGDPAAILALASHFDDQAFAGLLDPTREEHCRAHAVDGYTKYLELCPDDQEVDLRLARLQLRRGLYDHAEPRLRRLAESGHGSARLWLMETLFAQRRYADLRHALAQFGAEQADAMPLEASEAIELWTGRGLSEVNA